MLFGYPWKVRWTTLAKEYLGAVVNRNPPVNGIDRRSLALLVLSYNISYANWRLPSSTPNEDVHLIGQANRLAGQRTRTSCLLHDVIVDGRISERHGA